ncbi:MAG: phosphatidylserine decarboxylase [Elusimicrobia bacterium]|nr:phosphatidylserine decarboxylase [Elusimicrobiota bacterium]MBD3412320.1 phosphatidylserine decarboxylase [Elusimicrobiota bacterium]
MIVKEGWPFVIGFSIIGIIGLAGAIWFILPGVVVAGLSFVCACFMLFFFRDPVRNRPADEHVIVSPADGTILSIEQYQDSATGRGIMIKIFLSIFDVHLQRAPVAGTVTDIRYHKGSFLPAMHAQAANRNERNVVVMKTVQGCIEITQIAGILARRIVCWAKHGTVLGQGDKFGLICFGSQVDMALPGHARVTVQKGDSVRAGITVVGTWQ